MKVKHAGERPMGFNELDFDRQPYKPGERENTSAPGDVAARQRDGQLRQLELAGLALLMDCMLPADSPDKARKEELTKQAEKTFPTGFEAVRPLYVADRLAIEFPKTNKPLSEEDKIKLRYGMVKREAAGWRGELGHLDPNDQPRLNQAMLNVLRWFPKMPEDIRRIAEQREIARLNKRPDFQNLPSLRDSAKLDAWLRLPAGTDKERADLAKKLVRWKEIESGTPVDPLETVAEKGERLYPGSKDVQKLFLKCLSGARPGPEELRLLTVWNRTISGQMPYSAAWTSLESLYPLKAWDPKDPDAPANPIKFYDKVRQAKLHQGNESAEDNAILTAYKIFSNNPRAWELDVRRRMAPEKDNGEWKKLTVREATELKIWTESSFKNIWNVSQDRARALSAIDREKLTKAQFDELLILQGLANVGR